MNCLKLIVYPIQGELHYLGIMIFFNPQNEDLFYNIRRLTMRFHHLEFIELRSSVQFSAFTLMTCIYVSLFPVKDQIRPKHWKHFLLIMKILIKQMVFVHTPTINESLLFFPQRTYTWIASIRMRMLYYVQYIYKFYNVLRIYEGEYIGRQKTFSFIS